MTFAKKPINKKCKKEANCFLNREFCKKNCRPEVLGVSIGGSEELGGSSEFEIFSNLLSRRPGGVSIGGSEECLGRRLKRSFKIFVRTCKIIFIK